MPQTIAAADPRLRWSGSISNDVSPNGVMPWRIPHDDMGLYAEELVGRAAMPAGVRVSFQSDTSFLAGECNAFPERSPIDLMIGGELVGTAPTEDLTSFRFDDLGTEMKSFELWLPQFGEFQLMGMSVSDDAELLESENLWLPKWITYGSSITHCRAADSPTLTWPSIVARTRGYDLTCLGFGGQCHLDPLIARVIRDRDADLISLCLGINIYGNDSLNARTFGPGIIGFVQIIREKHPDTPIALLSPIYSPGREDTLNAVGFTLSSMRGEVASAVDKLRAHGDNNIHYINGLDIFNADNAHLLPDDLHPNSEGYGIMASNLLTLLPQV
ncbi:MAG: GDSL family lipase [Chloroflexi bacterium]|nr:GDSL family lipase [Chloroflexota bacterium]